MINKKTLKFEYFDKYGSTATKGKNFTYFVRMLTTLRGLKEEENAQELLLLKILFHNFTQSLSRHQSKSFSVRAPYIIKQKKKVFKTEIALYLMARITSSKFTDLKKNDIFEILRDFIVVLNNNNGLFYKMGTVLSYKRKLIVHITGGSKESPNGPIKFVIYNNSCKFFTETQIKNIFKNNEILTN